MRASKLAALLLTLAAVAAHAGGPRFVTGPPFFTAPAGQPIGWRQHTLTYFTDPAALSSTVNHAAADSLVAAAASVWNVPVARISIAQGGTLAEHVSGANTYLDTNGLVFPADVSAANAAAIPVAVLYDSDGSLTDLLLGSGASQPSSCRQNGVTESVDTFDPAGFILHAILIVNGRCIATDPNAQTELQYQLMRAFGRILGLAWSQTNDNVFTGSPAPTQQQELNWPIMHPLDIICGTYAFQCMLNPFTLRPDDIASLVAVYPVAQGSQPAAARQVSLAAASAVAGTVSFPTGEGMAGVNMLVQRQPDNITTFDAYFESSAVTGASYAASGTSPFVIAPANAYGSFGARDISQLGAYSIAYVPMEPGAIWQNLRISAEPVNPLYAGSYSLGPYAPGNVLPSGPTPAAQIALTVTPGQQPQVNFTVAGAASTCGNGQDGTPATPMQVPSSGLWTGLLCGYGHASYIASAVRPNRSFTIEVTALDEQGLPTESKAMPVIGLFAPTDPPGSLPSLGLAGTAFASDVFATTSITASTAQLPASGSASPISAATAAPTMTSRPGSSTPTPSSPPPFQLLAVRSPSTALGFVRAMPSPSTASPRTS